MSGNLRCIDGRICEHRPQPDDPYFEVDIGACPDRPDCDCECSDRREPVEEEDVMEAPSPGGMSDLSDAEIDAWLRSMERLFGKGWLES